LSLQQVPKSNAAVSQPNTAQPAPIAQEPQEETAPKNFATEDEHIYALRHVSERYVAADFEKKNGPRILTSSPKIMSSSFWRATKTQGGTYLLESMSTGGFIGADERGNVVLDMNPLEVSTHTTPCLVTD